MRHSCFFKVISTATLTLIVAFISGCGNAADLPIGSSPSAEITSSSISFGAVTSGTSNAAQNVTLSNTGQGVLNIASIVVSGVNAISFSESNNCSLHLAAGSSCIISAGFSPVAAGAYAAVITITDDSSTSVQTISLSGNTTPASVSVTPAAVTLGCGQSAQLTATIVNVANKAVTWSILPAGVGSISPSGLYTAPATATSPAVAVTATSQADTTASSSTIVTFVSSVSVIVTPTVLALNSGQAAQLTAKVTNAQDSSVIWRAALGGVTTGGLYTAPSNTGSGAVTDMITATSVQDPTKSATATVSVAVSSGLVGWWPLDEGTGLVAHDISGQINDGAWSGFPSSPNETYYTAGVIDSYAGYFDGSDNKLTIGTQPVYQLTGPFTVSTWVSTTASGTILSMQDGGNNGYNLAIIFGVIRFCVYANTKETCVGGGHYPAISPAWTKFTGVFDGSNILVYANGVVVASVPAAAPTASAGPLAFGVAQRGGYSNFVGSAQDVRIYSRALSANEISSSYNLDAGTPNPPTNLQAYPGKGQVGLSWNAPTSGFTLTNYIVDYRQHNTLAWSTFSHPASTATSIIVTGLANGLDYDFEVTGVNITGAGLPSDILIAGPAATPPLLTLSVAPNVTKAAPGTNVSFIANVTNALDASVTWNAMLGSITAEGLYTAPSNIGSTAVTDTVTATSVEDPTRSAIATVTISSGLVGWWPMDEGMGLAAHDISGQGNTGTWSGVPSSPSGTYYSPGLIGPYAGYFDGSDDKLTIGTKPVYQFTGPFTVTAWVNTVASGTILSMQNGGINGYNLAINYGIVRFCVYNATTQTCAGGGHFPLSSPAWTFFAAVFDGSRISVYANGFYLGSASAAAPTASSGPLVIGLAQRGGYSNLVGSLDDVRLYDRALSANEISSVFNPVVGTPNAPVNLQAYAGNSQVGLSWDTPTQGAVVTDYHINFRQSGTIPWSVFSRNPSIVNAQVITGLANGISYDFELIPVSAIGDGAASSIVTATPAAGGSLGGGSHGGSPAGGSASVVASDDDEFVGPFSSWLNVKTDFGAVGDGKADDTLAFQYALNALGSSSAHSSILYVPAGIYKISSGLNYISKNCATFCTGKSIIGENPENTILNWQGSASGAAMITLDGISRMQVDRLTLDGSGAQISLINETMHQGCCYDGSNEYTDDVFENAAVGIQAGDNTVGCCSAETKVDRDTFENLTVAGISLEDWNAVDWYVRYSTFEHDGFGVTNIFGEGGAMHLDHNLFEYNNVDSGWGNGSSQSYTYNTSYHSGTFLSGSPYGNSSILIGNTILEPQIAAISMPGIGPLTLIGNTIEGTITAAQGGQTIKFSNGAVSIPNSYVLSMGNTYTSATPFSVQNVTYATNEIIGDLTSMNDAVVSAASIKDSLPMMPGPLPNYNRTIYEVPQGASSATIQQTIDQAITQSSGSRPVVHIPWGQYYTNSTITIPSSSDVQLIGDNMQTIINWTGSTSSPVFELLPQSHATFRSFTINAGSSLAGISVEGNDQPGDRIYTNFVGVGLAGSSHNLLVSGFDNTLVQMDDFGHGGMANPSSASVLVVGGPKSQAGISTPGYTGLFMGSSCCNTGPSYRVESGGTVVLTGFWYEQGGTQWLDLDGASGNFIGYEDNTSVDSWGPLTGAVPALTAKNFTGNLTIANSGINNTYINLAGSTPANVLLLGDSFNLGAPPVIADTNTNASTQAATIYPTWVNGSVNYTVPDEVAPSTSRNTLLQSSLSQLSSYKDPPITDLPSTNEDVRFIDLVVNNGVNSFDFQSTASQLSTANQTRPAINNGSPTVATPASRPTSPWCKPISEQGSGSNVNNRARGAAGWTRVLAEIDSCKAEQ
jgi:hypothetical protein